MQRLQTSFAWPDFGHRSVRASKPDAACSTVSRRESGDGSRRVSHELDVSHEPDATRELLVNEVFDRERIVLHMVRLQFAVDKLYRVHRFEFSIEVAPDVRPQFIL